GTGANAALANNGTGLQQITVNNADRVRVHGEVGDAIIFAAGNQAILVQGSATQNKLDLGSATDTGSSRIVSGGSSQLINVGTAAQAGAVNITGGVTNGKSSVIANTSTASGAQTVTTTGTIVLAGGTATGGTLTCATDGACATISNA